MMNRIFQIAILVIASCASAQGQTLTDPRFPVAVEVAPYATSTAGQVMPNGFAVGAAIFTAQGEVANYLADGAQARQLALNERLAYIAANYRPPVVWCGGGWCSPARAVLLQQTPSVVNIHAPVLPPRQIIVLPAAPSVVYPPIPANGPVNQTIGGQVQWQGGPSQGLYGAPQNNSQSGTQSQGGQGQQQGLTGAPQTNSQGGQGQYQGQTGGLQYQTAPPVQPPALPPGWTVVPVPGTAPGSAWMVIPPPAPPVTVPGTPPTVPAQPSGGLFNPPTGTGPVGTPNPSTVRKPPCGPCAVAKATRKI